MTDSVMTASTGNEEVYEVGGGEVAFAAPPKDFDNVYDALKAEFNKPAEAEPLTLAVPNRPNMKIVFDPNIDYDDFKMFFRNATDRKKKRVDSLELAFGVIQDTMIGMTLNGEPLIDDEGDPFTVATPELRNILGAISPRDALRKIYGSDGHIIAAAGKILEAAGYTDQDLDDDDDPKW